jgi:hypothetical protein
MQVIVAVPFSCEAERALVNILIETKCTAKETY